MSEFVAVNNNDFEIEASPTAPNQWEPGDPNSDTDMTLTLIEGKAAVQEDKVLINNIAWAVIKDACILSGYTHVGGASTAPILATAIKGKSTNLALLREGDQGLCTGSFTQGTTTVTCTCTFKINKAGQEELKSK